MNRPILLVFACLILPLAACAWLNPHAVDAPGAFPDVKDVSSETSATTTAEALLPPLEEMCAQLNAQALELRVELVTYELALGIVNERTPGSALNPVSLDEAFSAMFENPEDPASPPKANWFKEFSRLVTYLSDDEVTLHQTTAEDPVFSRHQSAQKTWRAAHVFIRVEKAPKDGKKKSFGIIISAPEPAEKRTSFPIDEEDVSPVAPILSPLGQ